jgi:hypothetical protein
MTWIDALETSPQNLSEQEAQAEVWPRRQIVFDGAIPEIYDANVAEAGAERPVLAVVQIG